MKPLGNNPVAPGIRAQRTDAASSVTAQAGAPVPTPRTLQTPDAPWQGVAIALGGGLPPATIAHHLDRAARSLEAIAGRPLPADKEMLAATYSELGHATAAAEASLMSALDALDPNTGGGRADPAAPFEALKQRGFAALRRAGEVFAAVEPAFKKLVHGSGGWPTRPVEVRPDRGDGQPLNHYENTFKLAGDLTLEKKQAEYARRVEGFRAEGGDPAALRLATPDDLAAMTHGIRYDYAMLADGERMRMMPRSGPGAQDPGHSLLAVGGNELIDEPVLLAGEMWALRDSAGDLEALFVANNSGHFKPKYEDLVNALPVLGKLGIPPEKIVVFGGPNNLPAMMNEMSERTGLEDPAGYLPPSARELLASWHDATTLSPLSVRF